VRSAIRTSPRVVDLVGADRDGARGLLFGSAGPSDPAVSDQGGRNLVGESGLPSMMAVVQQVLLTEGEGGTDLGLLMDSEVRQMPAMLSESGYGLVAVDVARAALASDDGS